MGRATQVIVRKLRKLGMCSFEWLVVQQKRLVYRPVHRRPPPRYCRLAKPCRLRVNNEPERFNCCRRQEQASVHSSEPFNGTWRTQKNAKRSVQTTVHTFQKTHTKITAFFSPHSRSAWLISSNLLCSWLCVPMLMWHYHQSINQLVRRQRIRHSISLFYVIQLPKKTPCGGEFQISRIMRGVWEI